MIFLLIAFSIFCTAGTESQTRRLRQGAVPSQFPWNKETSPAAVRRSERQDRKRCRLEEVQLIDIDDVSHTIDVKTTVPAETPSETMDADMTTFATVGAQASGTHWTPICIERIMFDNDMLHHFTGLESYETFTFVLASLGPAAFELEYRSHTPKNISVENQFLMTLVRLRRNMPFKELAYSFEITEYVVSNIYVTWINFMYHQLKEVDIWPDQEIVRYFIPEDFKKLYPKTRIILDGMECPIKKPKKPAAQQATYSTYKNRNTLKAVIGATPGGLISYIPHFYGGSASDRALVERSTLPQDMDPNDQIMVDKGFNVQHIFAIYDIGVNLPTFLKKRTQFTAKARNNDRKIASKRVHIERIIGLGKTYKVLVEPMNSVDTMLGSRIGFVCFMLCNFRSCIVPRNA